MDKKGHKGREETTWTKQVLDYMNTCQMLKRNKGGRGYIELDRVLWSVENDVKPLNGERQLSTLHPILSLSEFYEKGLQLQWALPKKSVFHILDVDALMPHITTQRLIWKIVESASYHEHQAYCFIRIVRLNP